MDWNASKRLTASLCGRRRGRRQLVEHAPDFVLFGLLRLDVVADELGTAQTHGVGLRLLAYGFCLM